MFKLFFLLCITLSITLRISAQTTVPSTAKALSTLKSLDALFQGEVRSKVAPPFQTGLKNLRAAYKASLDTSLKRHSSAGELDAALAVKEEMTRFASEGKVPGADASESNGEILRLRTAWRVEMSRLNEQRQSAMKPILEAHTARLRGLEVQLTKAMNLDAAKAVREILTALVATGEVNPPIRPLASEVANTPVEPKTKPQSSNLQKPVAIRAEDAQASIAAEIKTLPEEDQNVVKGLKFSLPEPAPLDSRHWTYIKGRIQVINSSPRNTITDKLKIEMLILCRNKDNESQVIRCVAGLEIPDKGKQVIDVSFREQNALFAKLIGNQKAPFLDSYTTVRYGGIVIAQFHGKPGSSSPKEWWKNEDLIYR